MMGFKEDLGGFSFKWCRDFIEGNVAVLNKRPNAIMFMPQLYQKCFRTYLPSMAS
jgi:hypothetical protein